MLLIDAQTLGKLAQCGINEDPPIMIVVVKVDYLICCGVNSKKITRAILPERDKLLWDDTTCSEILDLRSAIAREAKKWRCVAGQPILYKLAHSTVVKARQGGFVENNKLVELQIHLWRCLRKAREKPLLK